MFSYLFCLQGEIACDFFDFWTLRTPHVVDDLIDEQIEDRDACLTDRNDCNWAAQEEDTVDHGLLVEVRKLTKMLHVCLAVTEVLVAIIVLSWIGQVYVSTLLSNMRVVSTDVE